MSGTALAARAPFASLFAFFARLLAVLVVLMLSACGGGSDGSTSAVPAPPNNVLTVTVDRGPDNAALNTPFVSVTVCQPGTTVCHTVDHVLVDTASFGLRLVASKIDSTLLPAVANAAGAPVAECAHFASGYVWGSVRRADVRLAGELALNLPVQVIADPGAAYSSVPAVCTGTGPNFGAALGVNGILGVGMINHDCFACIASAAPGVYFSCARPDCTSIALPLDQQVSNPVPAFATDNNGVALVLPSVSAGGASNLSGSLIFGIGTQPNNQLGQAVIYAADNRGNFTTTYKGKAFGSSFIDSGSNALIFSDPSIALCSSFYCPPQALSLSAVNTSATGVSGTVSFTVESIRSVTGNAAAANVAADVGLGNSFDWGLPFFFGRTVFVAVAGAATPRGTGPYWAY